jgi:hypothetical protein
MGNSRAGDPSRSFRPVRFHLPRITLAIAAATFACGCGGGSTPSTTPVVSPQDATVIGQYDLVLTSTNGHGSTNVYTDFSQTGATFTAAANTLVCPSNDLSQCQGDDPVISIAANGKVSGTSVTMAISFPTTGGADTITMEGTATGTDLSGTYTDSLGDSGTWTGFVARHPFGPPPAVYDYSGTFNSVQNPLLIDPTISVELGRDASSADRSYLTGQATIMNSPCISFLTLSGQSIGDAFILTDARNKARVVAPPTLPGDSLTFSYKLDPTAASCPGDFGRGTLTINSSPWDY